MSSLTSHSTGHPLPIRKAPGKCWCRVLPPGGCTSVPEQTEEAAAAPRLLTHRSRHPDAQHSLYRMHMCTAAPREQPYSPTCIVGGLADPSPRHLAHTHTSTRTRARTHTHTYTHAYTHTRTHACTHSHTHLECLHVAHRLLR